MSTTPNHQFPEPAPEVRANWERTRAEFEAAEAQARADRARARKTAAAREALALREAAFPPSPVATAHERRFRASYLERGGRRTPHDYSQDRIDLLGTVTPISFGVLAAVGAFIWTFIWAFGVTDVDSLSGWIGYLVGAGIGGAVFAVIAGVAMALVAALVFVPLSWIRAARSRAMFDDRRAYFRWEDSVLAEEGEVQ